MGKVEFLEGIHTNGTNRSINQDIVFGNNSIYVNSTGNPGLNVSANLTLYNVPTNFVNPAIYKNNIPCLDCYNFTPLDSSTVKFNVTSFSNYTVQDYDDNDSPSIIINTPTNETKTNRTQLLNITATDLYINTIWYNLGGINISYSSPIEINLSEGNNTIHAWANDSFQNTNYTNISFFVDTIAPNVSFNLPINGATYTTPTITINITNSSDAISVWWNNGTNNITYTNSTSITLNNGEYTYAACANDTYGNKNCTEINFIVAVSIPAVGSNTGSSSGGGSSSSTIIQNLPIQPQATNNTLQITSNQPTADSTIETIMQTLTENKNTPGQFIIFILATSFFIGIIIISVRKVTRH
jgi:hypothetical protein